MKTLTRTKSTPAAGRSSFRAPLLGVMHMRRICSFIFLISVCSFGVASNEDEFAYVIFKAHVSDKPKQPTFIAFFLKYDDIHIKANDTSNKNGVRSCIVHVM